MNKEQGITLSDEQQLFINMALTGENILVDACIGSGKTTAIQQFCNVAPANNRILYLTYNRLLKIDAKSKIQQKNVIVTNYHSYAYSVLKHAGISAGVPDLIQTFIRCKPEIEKYDILIIDEYQDIDSELSELLHMIKEANPQMQIIAVGDMEQKIYDKTSLNVPSFINAFLGFYQRLEFTQCFRLSSEMAEMLGRVWNKTIKGVNPLCVVEELNFDDVIEALSEEEPKDILCLGARTGSMSKALNTLEKKFPDKFNKKTVYASISDINATGATEPNAKSAIFTTFDSSKGLERKICVLFDFTESYWSLRINHPQVSYEILRNIFCVAASRGKNKIIIVNEKEARLSERTLSTYVPSKSDFKIFDMSSMFDFKYKEDVENCYNLLTIEKVETGDKSFISINNRDELIDLSPCIGIYQEATFFDSYNIDLDIKLYHFLRFESDKYDQYTKNEQKILSLDEKILYLTSLETRQNRYRTQVNVPFVTEEQRLSIVERLCTQFSSSEKAQVKCKLSFASDAEGNKTLTAMGMADVVKDDTVYELKFVSELEHEHFLQCACYMVALKLTKGILWNTRDNSMYKIEIQDVQQFLNRVVYAITKGVIKRYYPTVTTTQKETVMEEKKPEEKQMNFAVIDTETTWNDEVMSIGVVIADSKKMEVIDSVYFLIDPAYKRQGMYSYALWQKNSPEPIIASRQAIIEKLCSLFASHNVHRLLAYNALFDKEHLPELDSYTWCDIMRLAAYRQYNHHIPDDCEFCKTGRMKKGYGVEAILRMLGDDIHYIEKHNAYLDAMDEFRIVQLLGYNLDAYEVGRLSEIKKQSTDKKDIPQIEDYNILTGPNTQVNNSGAAVKSERGYAEQIKTPAKKSNQNNKVSNLKKVWLDTASLDETQSTIAEKSTKIPEMRKNIYHKMKIKAIKEITEAEKENEHYKMSKSSGKDSRKCKNGVLFGVFLLLLIIVSAIIIYFPRF